MSSDTVNKGGSPNKAPAPAVGGDGCAAADTGCAPQCAAAVARRHNLPPRPPPMAADSAVQSAVRARLDNMLANNKPAIWAANSVSDIGRTVLGEDRSWVGQPKQVR